MSTSSCSAQRARAQLGNGDSTALGAPVNGIIEVAGPAQFRLDELVRRYLEARHDPRPVIADPRARYFGAKLEERTLVPDQATLGTIGFDDWLSRQSPRPNA